MLVVRAVAVGVEVLAESDVCRGQRGAEVRNRARLGVYLGVAHILEKDNRGEAQRFVVWQQLFQVLARQVENGTRVVVQELEQHRDSRHGRDAGRATERLHGTGDTIDEFRPVVYRIQQAVAVLILGEVVCAEAFGARITCVRLEVIEGDCRTLVDRRVHEVEMDGKRLVAGAVYEPQGSDCIKLAYGLADRYLVAAHDAEVRWDKGDDAAEVEVFRVADPKVHREVCRGLGIGALKGHLKDWIESACFGGIGACHNQQQGQYSRHSSPREKRSSSHVIRLLS